MKSPQLHLLCTAVPELKHTGGAGVTEQELTKSGPHHAIEPE